ncbi:hypothetical protein HDF16_006056 [Granulicella aggregans]|uniref:DUF4386 domain-containing protein n=1 Tax=Granulicella aggregans TaxID=474949 RepID=A0A7W7ZJZ3_9BACT|nr:DUF4386 domain-containing protein [Granulicella aggregans]MBB5061320.1 hypothetical protein [Granulicella aggregans]
MIADTAQHYARWIGALFLVSIVAGGWGESYVPDKLFLANDLAGTAHEMANSVGLFRSSFAAYLIEVACDITLNVLLYALLRPVSRTLSLLAMCFGLMGTAIFATGELLYFAAALPAIDADVARVISSEAKATLTYLCITIYGYGFGIFAMFYGIAAAVRGYLIWHSGYLPRTLGAVGIVGGASFVVKNFMIVLAPRADLPYVIAPMMLAMLSMGLWLLVKGVDRAHWDTMQAAQTTSKR